MELLKLAESRFGKVNAIISAYTMKVVWGSKEMDVITGEGYGELEDVSLKDFIKVDPISITQMIADSLSGKKEYTTNITTKKSGAVKLRTKVETMTYQDEPYIIITDFELLN